MDQQQQIDELRKVVERNGASLAKAHRLIEELRLKLHLVKHHPPAKIRVRHARQNPETDGKYRQQRDEDSLGSI
jgi:uncharacterized membrane protein